MMKWLLLAAVIVGSVVVGAVSYEDYMYRTYQPRGEQLAQENATSCSQDSECPQIYCIRAPCPYNVCSDGVCKIVNPEEDSKYDKSCSVDSDCKLISTDCSSCNLEAVSVAQTETIDCSDYNGSVCRVAPLRVSCDAGRCVSVSFAR